MASVRPAEFQLFSLKDDPEGLCVAEVDGEILGYAFSWVCGGLWFLAELFVAPAQQGLGIGNQLLKRTLEHASKAGATNKALITFTFNIVSQGLYIRHGLFPRVPVYFFSAARDALIGRMHGEKLPFTRIEPAAADLAGLARIDESALGFSREKHHKYLLGDGAMKGFFFRERGALVGYAYISASGHVGPLATTQPGAVGPALTTALDLAAESGAPQASAFLPGASGAALRVASAHGMRITFPMVLMSERDFGDWSRYLPRNPGFM